MTKHVDFQERAWNEYLILANTRQIYEVTLLNKTKKTVVSISFLLAVLSASAQDVAHVTHLAKPYPQQGMPAKPSLDTPTAYSPRQGVYDSVLRRIEANSTALIALRQQMKVEQLDYPEGLYPPGPEAEFIRRWGSPSDIVANTEEWTISQSFDFPTAYFHRGKIANLQNDSAEYAYKAQRLDLLLSARRVCVELIYNNALAKEYAIRLQHTAEIAKSYRVKFDKGEANILELNKARLNHATMQTVAARVETERAALLAELKGMNGGVDIDFSVDSYPVVALPGSFEDWYKEIEATNPVMQLLSGQVEIGKQQVKLTRTLNLPKFSLGYTNEKTLNERLRGVSFGLSIPLWENKGRVAQARAQVLAAEYALKDTRTQFYNRLQTLYAKAAALQKGAQGARQSLTDYDSQHLLKKTLDAGEISLINYFLEMEYYYDATNKLLETERDFELNLAELEAVGL